MGDSCTKADPCSNSLQRFEHLDAADYGEELEVDVHFCARLDRHNKLPFFRL